tara:strand:- start:1046 stop:2713 length:1668 start_codon:yes stop_codon:yes gene_type:complete
MNGNFDTEVPRGRVLPVSVNPRDGWDPNRKGGPDPRIEQFIMNDEILRKEGLRRAENERKENRKMAEEEGYQRSIEAAKKAAIKAHYDAIRDRHNKVLTTYKVHKCTIKENHNRDICHDYHLRSDRRRDPYSVVKYSCIKCPHETKFEMCHDGDECLMAHSENEIIYHPDKFKVTMCTLGENGSVCSQKKNFCIYAHDEEDLREPGIHLPTPAGSLKGPLDVESMTGSLLIEESSVISGGDGESTITDGKENDDEFAEDSIASNNKGNTAKDNTTTLSGQEGSNNQSQKEVNNGDDDKNDVDFKNLQIHLQDYEDDIILDGKEALKFIGTRNPRQKHTLSLRSCYENYSVAGEPFFTISVPEKQSKRELRMKKEEEMKKRGEEIKRNNVVREMCCMDYIFCSMHSIKVVSILSVPSLGQIYTEDPRQPKFIPDIIHRKIPPMMEQFYQGNQEKIFEKLGISNTKLPDTEEEINSNIARIKAELQRQLDAMKVMDLNKARKEKDFKFYMGQYVPHLEDNPDRFNRWLPNDKFSSSHFALVADVYINFDACCADWDT